MSSDWLSTLSATVFAYVLQIPFFVTLAISAAAIRKDNYGRWGKEFVLVAFGMWLFFWWLFLTIFQIALNMPREDPFHPGEVYYGFPSSVGFYVSVLTVFVIEFTFVWNIQFSRLYWIGLYLCIIMPAIVLCWFQFNTWQEVALSMGWGTLVTTGFIALLYYGLAPQLPILINTAPCTWFSCVDTWIQSKEGQAVTEEMRMQFEVLEKKAAMPSRNWFRAIY